MIFDAVKRIENAPPSVIDTSPASMHAALHSQAPEYFG